MAKVPRADGGVMRIQDGCSTNAQAWPQGLIAQTRLTPGLLRHHLTFSPPSGGPPATYTVELRADQQGTFLATCAEFPEVTTFGEDEEEALVMVRQLIDEALWVRRIRLAAAS